MSKTVTISELTELYTSAVEHLCIKSNIPFLPSTDLYYLQGQVDAYHLALRMCGVSHEVLDEIDKHIVSNIDKAFARKERG